MMDDLLAKHRKEQRDLQSRITQKKKQASKKTRKSVNEECDTLERELRRQQEDEVKALNGEAPAGQDGGFEDLTAEQIQALTLRVDGDDKDDNITSTNAPSANRSSLEPASPSTHPHATENLSSTPAKHKPNRQKARLARRAAEQEAVARAAADEAQNLPDLKQQERERMLSGMAEHGLVEKEIRADGHCLYSAVADQLETLSLSSLLGQKEEDSQKIEPFRRVRYLAADFIARHREDFEPFLEEEWESYVHKVRETGEWGGQVELMALARGLAVDINVLQDFGRVERFVGENEDGRGEEKKKRLLWLGYYKHGFGLGEHYNSLRRKAA